MPKFAIATLGCKVNQYESAGIVEELKKRGYTLVPFAGSADIYIVNTCTVTGRTDNQSRQLIRRAYRNNPSASIIATGCYAQTAPEELAGLPGVAMVVGTGEKEDIPDMMSGGKPLRQITVTDIAGKKEYSGLCPGTIPGHTRAFLKIQDGCNAFCSYCIVPYARGRSRSLPEKAVIEEIRRFNSAGYREIVLTGIHLGHYGADLSPDTGLLHLLRKIEDETAVARVRLSSIEPTEITDELIGHIGDSEVICRHLHIPLQSGDDGILRTMKRHYDATRFRDRIEAVAEALPGVAIGIDVMVGFPGEGEQEFENTKALIEELPVAYLHIFPYSRRPGTVAAELPIQVQESIKKERGKILRNIGMKKRMEYNKMFIGKRLSVLVENTKDRQTGLMKGFSDNYIPVLIGDGDRSLANTIVDVVADHREGGRIHGRKA